MKFDKDGWFWLFEAPKHSIVGGGIEIITDSGTDFWQRTYYGFRNDNAHALLVKKKEETFSFSLRTDFDTKCQFDQCGVLIYQNSDNWFKASIEYENDEFQRLGSVVTNNGYSDWATTDIPAERGFMYYRLSRRGSDFCVENSTDGTAYKQMRIFHLFEGAGEINIGIYACSPGKSSFRSFFSEIEFSDCKWAEHK